MWHKLTMIGRTGKDSTTRFMPNGDPVTSFSVAVDDGFGENKKTIWLNVSAFGKLAETLKDMRKGTLLLVEGRLQHDSGNPRVFKRTDGSSASSFEVNASTVRFLSSKGEQEEDVEF